MHCLVTLHIYIHNLYNIVELHTSFVLIHFGSQPNILGNGNSLTGQGICYFPILQPYGFIQEKVSETSAEEI